MTAGALLDAPASAEPAPAVELGVAPGLLIRPFMAASALRIKDLPAEERPRERMLDLGPDGLASAELLAILLGSGSRGRSALDVARDLLAEAGSLPDLMSRDPAELARMRGVGPAGAARLAAALALGRRAMLPSGGRRRLDGPETAAELLLPHYQGRDREHFGVLLLDARHGILARRTIAIGSLNSSLVHPREVFRPAIALRAAAILLFHNHPSGDPTPSPEDIALTRRLVEVGRTMGIDVVDHVVLGDGRFASLREARAGGL